MEPKKELIASAKHYFNYFNGLWPAPRFPAIHK